MSASSPVMRVRLRPWSFLLLAVLVVAALWLLNGRQPAPWPEAELPWSAQVDAGAPATVAIDRANALTAWAPNVPLASVAVLVLAALVTLTSLGAVEVPVALAVSVAMSLVFVRSAWSTATPGLDARPLLVTSLAVLSVVRTDLRWLSALSAAATLVLSPSSAWLVLPALLAAAPFQLTRVLSALAFAVAALAMRAWGLERAWDGIACLPAEEMRHAVVDVLRPGATVDVSPWWSLRHTAGVLQGDLHTFGLALAAVGLFSGSSRHRLRVATGLAVGLAALTSVTGLLPPARSAVLLLPWALPWMAIGLQSLVARADGVRTLAAACAGLVIVAIPMLRHAVITPGTWRAGSPAIARAVSRTWDGGLVAADDAMQMRRLRTVGAATVPAEPALLASCIAAARPVYALGATVSRVQGLGFLGTDHALQAPLADVLTDLRTGAYVMLAISPGTLPFVGPAGLRALERIGVPRSGVGALDAIGLVARVGRGGTARTGAGGIDLSLAAGATVGGDWLLAPWSASAAEGDADIDSPPARLASSRHAALVVLDRTQEIALRTVGAPRAGLPIGLGTHEGWRQVRVLGQRTCTRASTAWTTVAPHQRLSVPVPGASTAQPAIVWAASDAAPEPAVRGLPFVAGRPSWTSVTFDRDAPADATALAIAVRDDGLDATSLGPSRFLTRISLQPAMAALGGHASVSAGVPPMRWVVRLAASATRPEHVDVCAMPDGDRVLDGQAGLVDDDTARELTVATRDGWHQAERDHGVAFQWTARPTATVTFRAEPLHDLVLAIDAIGADVGAGAQPVTIRVNGQVIAQGWRGAGRITVPAAMLPPEIDVLSLDVPQVARPARDARPLGVLVRQLRLIGPAS